MAKRARARAHRPRPSRPEPAPRGTFVKLNCAAIPTGLLESELFGHEKGAFTGAICQKVGRFELAHRGRCFSTRWATSRQSCNPNCSACCRNRSSSAWAAPRRSTWTCRLVAATNRDLAAMVADGRFRSDLYYRLNVFPLVLPPLRDRSDDIPPLVRHFTQRFARRMGRRIETIPSAVMEALVRYAWPGNIRELQNVIERAVILSAGSSLQVPPGDLQPADHAGAADAERSGPRSNGPRASRWPTPSESTSSVPSARPAGWWAGRRGPRPGWG